MESCQAMFDKAGTDLYPSMTPLGRRGWSQLTITELLEMEWVDTLRGALGTKERGLYEG